MMKKQKLYLVFSALVCSLTINAQKLPTPLWKFDFTTGSLNGSAVTATSGTAKAIITDGNKAAKTDGVIINDIDRGSVLQLPNISENGTTGGDAAPNYRSLRITDQQGGTTDVSLVGATAYAISFWVKAAPTTLHTFPPILAFDDLPNARAYEMRVKSSLAGGTRTALRILDGVRDRVVATTYPSVDHAMAWCHYLIQRNPVDKNVYLYINGTLIGKTFYNGEVTDLATADKCVLNENLKHLRFNSLAHGGFTYLSDIQAFDQFLDDEQIKELIADVKLQVTTVAYPAEGGTVTETLNVGKGEEVSVTATANEDYTFSHWTDGDTIVTRDATYTFTVSEACKVTAIFNEKEAVVLPALEVDGLNYSIAGLRDGAQPFSNRTVVFQNTAVNLIGMQYTQIVANGFTTPNTQSSLSVIAKVPGYVYVMTNDSREDTSWPADIMDWASTHGWEKVPSLSKISQYDKPSDLFSVYRKAIQANSWLVIPQPSIFPGALLIAPSLVKYSIENGVESSLTSAIKIYAQGNSLMIEGAEEAMVTVYSASGAQAVAAQIDGSANISLPQGIYIVKVVAANESRVEKIIIK